MRWDFFHKTESRRFDPDKPAVIYSFDLPGDIGPAEALERAYMMGLPKGSARGGCFEIQNDKGIWSHQNGTRLNFRTDRTREKIMFVPWDSEED